MSEPEWMDQMNRDWAAAKTDEERMAALEKHMSPDQARAAFANLTTGQTGVRDESDRRGTGRHDD